MHMKKDLFSSRRAAAPLALLAMFFWGSLYPCIKLSYRALSIDAARPADILLFAGVRFLICGAALLLAACACSGGRSLRACLPERRSLRPILLIALTGYAAHYTCTYLGVSLIESSKTALLKQTGSLLLICFAFLFRKEDRLTARKLISGLLGFAGILAINLDGLQVHLGRGEALVLTASLCSAASMLVSKAAYDRLDPLSVTAWAQLFGGATLTAAGLLLGGRMGRVTPEALALFGYLCLASCLGYALWNLLLAHNDLSRLNQIKFAEPLFGALCSAVLLGENILRPGYLAAFGCVFAGIWLGGGNDREAAFLRKAPLELSRKAAARK